MPNPYIDPRKRYQGQGGEPPGQIGNFNSNRPDMPPGQMEDRFKFVRPVGGTTQGMKMPNFGVGNRGGFGGFGSSGFGGSNPLVDLLEKLRKKSRFGFEQPEPTQNRMLSRYLGGGGGGY